MLSPVPRQSLSDAVYEQLRDRIVSGDWPAGHEVPSERSMCEALGVNRGALREALRRLEQAGLVEVRHGGASRVLDYRRHAGLALLPELVSRSAPSVDASLVAAVMEMRSAVATDVARLAARRGGSELRVTLPAHVERLEQARDDLPQLQDRVTEFWDTLVDASGNLAYRLAYNALRDSYQAHRSAFTEILAPEIRDAAPYAELCEAVLAGDSERAGELAAELVKRGESAVKEALEKWQ
ncbi:MAG: FadR/GntR family transcriptional regulator [Myxococcota bacterium]